MIWSSCMRYTCQIHDLIQDVLIGEFVLFLPISYQAVHASILLDDRKTDMPVVTSHAKSQTSSEVLSTFTRLSALNCCMQNSKGDLPSFSSLWHCYHVICVEQLTPMALGIAIHQVRTCFESVSCTPSTFLGLLHCLLYFKWPCWRRYG